MKEQKTSHHQGFSDLAFRITVQLTVLLPAIGFVAAIYLLWGQWVTWVELALCFTLYALTACSVSVGYHRLFTHRSFEAKPWVRAVLGVLASMAAEGPLFFWVAIHRQHHQKTDREGDPHSPHGFGDGVLAVLRGCWHAHVGWMFHPPSLNYARKVTDVLRDRMCVAVSRHYMPLVLLGCVIPAFICGLVRGSWFGMLMGFVWGGLVRIFIVHHVTWSVNSICHLFGSQPYDAGDESRNNIVFGLLSFGEGWHNNHHAFPNSARLGLKWWQVDFGWMLLWLLAQMKQVWAVRLPTNSVATVVPTTSSDMMTPALAVQKL